MGAMKRTLLEQADRCRICEERPRQVECRSCGELYCCRQCAVEHGRECPDCSETMYEPDRGM
jgi:hypothetical protein